MKAYKVLLMSSLPQSITAVNEVLATIGKVAQVDVRGPTVFIYAVRPDNQDMTATDILDKVRAVVKVFGDKVLVTVYDSDGVASLNLDMPTELRPADEEDFTEREVQRNFSRFSTRHEAYLQWEKERPRWVYSDGVNMAITVDFNDWCWLPIRRNGIYEKSLEQKYLR